MTLLLVYTRTLLILVMVPVIEHLIVVLVRPGPLLPDACLTTLLNCHCSVGMATLMRCSSREFVAIALVYLDSPRSR